MPLATWLFTLTGMRITHTHIHTPTAADSLTGPNVNKKMLLIIYVLWQKYVVFFKAVVVIVGSFLCSRRQTILRFYLLSLAL